MNSFKDIRKKFREMLAGMEWWEVIEIAGDVSLMLDYKAKQQEEKHKFEEIMKGI